MSGIVSIHARNCNHSCPGFMQTFPKRLEDPTRWPSLKTLDRAAAALGKRLILTLE